MPTDGEPRDPYGFDACMESVRFYVDDLMEDPIRLLGRWTLRARKDVLFNRTMVDALNALIDERGITY